MDATAIALVSGAVVVLVQLVKFGGLPDRWGVFAVVLLAALGVGVWVYAHPSLLMREAAFDVFAAWITVSASAAGIFGFTRAIAPSSVTATRRPPPGPGQAPTITVAEDR